MTITLEGSPFELIKANQTARKTHSEQTDLTPTIQQAIKLIYMDLLLGTPESPISLNKSTSFILTGYETGFLQK